MNKIILFIICLVAYNSSASAETFKNIEYQLPKSAKDWKIVQKKESDSKAIIVYSPTGNYTSNETLSIIFFNKPIESVNFSDALKKINEEFQKTSINTEIKLIEQENDGFTYSMKMEEEQVPKGYGLVRVISANNGNATVYVIYLDRDNVEANKINAEWVPVLKQVQIK